MTETVTQDVDANLFRRQRDLILAATGDGIYGVDVNGISLFVNPAAARMSGHSVDEMLGINLHDLIHHTKTDGSHYHVHECPIYAAAKDGKIHRVSNEVFWRKDGSSFPVEYISTPIWDEGKLVGAVVSFRDITDRLLAEEALKDSEKRYRAMFEDSSAAVFLMDASTRQILDSNKKSCQLLGYCDNQLSTMTGKDLFLGSPKNLTRFWNAVDENGSAETEALFCKGDDGSKISVRLSASTINFGGKAGLLVQADDLRRRNEAEASAQQLQSELHHVSRLSAMGEIASAMAHELNQPLSAVMNYIQASRRLLLASSTSRDVQILDYMEKSRAQAKRAGDIIRSLRTYVDKGDSVSTFECINTIVEEAILLTIPGRQAERVQLETELAEGLPKLLVQKIKIQQVIVNLVKNALEAMSQGEAPRLEVTTHLTDGPAIHVSICDNGPGLSEADTGDIFQSFISTKHDGMGVGLSICRSIIEDHDGQIWARNNEGDGACFSFTLPIISKGDDIHE